MVMSMKMFVMMINVWWCLVGFLVVMLLFWVLVVVDLVVDLVVFIGRGFGGCVGR